MTALRRPAVAGRFYPEETSVLAAKVDDLLANALREQRAARTTDTDTEAPKAIVAPHAGYVYSGAVAAQVYARVDSARARTLAGRAPAAAGERDRAAEELERAAAELAACGARRYREEAEHELRRLGRRFARRTRARKPDGQGLETLTRREFEDRV